MPTTNVAPQVMSLFNPSSVSNINIKPSSNMITSISFPIPNQISKAPPDVSYKNQITSKIVNVEKNTSIGYGQPELEKNKTWFLKYDGMYINPEGNWNTSKNEIYINPYVLNKDNTLKHEIGHKLTLQDINMPIGMNFTVPKNETFNNKMTYEKAKSYNPIGVNYIYQPYNETHNTILVPKKEFSEQMRDASGGFISRKIQNAIGYGSWKDNTYNEPIDEYKARAFVNYANNPVQFSQKYPMVGEYFDQRLNITKPTNLTQYKEDVAMKMAGIPAFSNKNLI